MERILKAESKNDNLKIGIYQKIMFEVLDNFNDIQNKILVVLNKLSMEILNVDFKYPEILSHHQLVHFFGYLNHFLYHSELKYQICHLQ